MAEKIIRIKNLYYKIKDGDEERLLLNGLNADFNSSEIIIISGPSGSGKTTLLYAI